MIWQGVGQLALDQSQLLVVALGGIDGGADGEHLVEGGGRLCHGHGVLLAHQRVGEHLLIVEGMAQLMGQRHNIAEGAVEVGEHPALPGAGDTQSKAPPTLPLRG